MGADGTGVAREVCGSPVWEMELVMEETKSVKPNVGGEDDAGTMEVKLSKKSSGDELNELFWS